MLDGAGDQMMRPGASGLDSAREREVVRLGAARGEDDLLRTGAQQRGDLGASGFHGVPRLAAERMKAGGVAE